MLEDLVEAVLAQALETVPDERRRPAEEDAADPLGTVDLGPALGVAGVEFRIDLPAGLDEVERSHGGVGRAASDDAAGHAGEEVFGGVGFDLAEGIVAFLHGGGRGGGFEGGHGGGSAGGRGGGGVGRGGRVGWEGFRMPIYC